ncbi:MAG: EAL domain-containing protein [Gammaproteobacteria bacterium]|nr:EAL domain-containing protein [Gammaproteobacteria bacterium]
MQRTQADAHSINRLILAGLGVTVFYVLSARLGLQLAVVQSNVTAVWPPSGIALAALLVFGLRLWPAIAAGAFITNFMSGLPLDAAIVIAAGNTLAAVIGAQLVTKLAGTENPLDTAYGLLTLLIGGGLVATLISATIGTTTLLESGLVSRPDFSGVWLTWWLGDTVGILILTPLLLTWKKLPVMQWSARRTVEAILLLACTLLVSQLVFGRTSPLGINHYPLAFLPLTTLIWAAMRFGNHGTTAVLCLFAASAIWGTIGGSGPFVRADVNESLLLLQAFMGVNAITSLLLATSLNERQLVQLQLDQHHLDRNSSLNQILETSLNEIYMFDRDTLRFLNGNQGARDNLGYTMEELQQLTANDIKPLIPEKKFREMIAPLLAGTEQHLKFETTHQRKDGTQYPVEVNLQLTRPGSDQVFVAIILDITERHASRQKLDHMANHDALTGLPNRFLFSDRLTHALQHCERNRHPLALMFLDLDGFKVINDSLGHPTGDSLLQQVAQRLQVAARKCDTVARLGGDEFTIILEDLDDLNSIPEIAQRILISFEEPFEVSGRKMFLGASIGISTYPQDGHDVTALMKYADVAMFQAKKDGGNKYQFYLADMTVAANQRLALETDIRHALENDGFSVHYQPQVCLENGRIVGMEALVRWQHPQHGSLPPTMFIPVAEETGLIEPLGEWVMRTACQQAKKWHDTLGINITISVNVSGHQINDRLVPAVRAVLADTGLDPRYLELEITESCIMDHTSGSINHLNRLRSLGVQLAIDDFGTGYSSMSYLKRLPVDKLKIDRSFVMDVPQDSNDMEIIKAILALAHALKMTVIAEGVETTEQCAFLAEHGCDVMQGYLFSRPCPAEEVELLLTSDNRTSIAGAALINSSLRGTK